MTDQQKCIFKRLLCAKTKKEKIAIGIELALTIPDDNRPHFANTSLSDSIGEIWRPIKGWGKFYHVSNYGRIKSFYRSFKEGRQGQPKKILHLNFDIGGYIVVALSRKGIPFYTRMHVLVCKTFGKYVEGLDCHHKNGIKLDNRSINIKPSTRSENIQHAYDNGLNKGAINHLGTMRYNAVLTEDLVSKIRIMIRDGYKKREVMNYLDISEISYKTANSKKAWRHVII